jgi:hypothetical protein
MGKCKEQTSSKIPNHSNFKNSGKTSTFCLRFNNNVRQAMVLCSGNFSEKRDTNTAQAFLTLLPFYSSIRNVLLTYITTEKPYVCEDLRMRFFTAVCIAFAFVIIVVILRPWIFKI